MNPDSDEYHGGRGLRTWKPSTALDPRDLAMRTAIKWTMAKLASLPTTPKLLVTHRSMSSMYFKLPESLHVEYSGSEGVEDSILEVISKRLQTLDLISIMKEAQRTLSMQKIGGINHIIDNLSAIPRFQTTGEQS